MLTLSKYDKIAIDTETTGLSHKRDRLFGISVASEDRSWYIDVRQDVGPLEALRNELKHYTGWITNHNIKFDVNFLRQVGIDLRDHKLDCTQIKAVLVNEHLHSYSLDSLAKKYLGIGKVDPYQELADMFGGKPTRKAQILNLEKAPRELVARYAIRDATLALALDDYLQKEICRQDLYKILDLERRVLKVIIDMEHQGIPVDVDQAVRTQTVLEGRIAKYQKELNRIAGFEINPNPSKSIVELFQPKEGSNGQWTAIDGTKLEKTPGGKASLNADALERMKHPAAALILKVRKLIKTKDVFIGGHILASEIGGRVYANINQVKSEFGGTVTGRLSVTAPALQQIPARDREIMALVRPLFIAPKGLKWYCADYSQCDARAFVHYTQSEPLIEAYQKDKYSDFHSLTASLTGLPRNAPKSGGANAKQFGLGLIFSMGEGRAAAEMGLPYKDNGKYLEPGPEAKKIFDNFHRAVPGIKEFAKRSTRAARDRGYVVSLMGRKLRFPDYNKCYKAAGFLFQSATAEVNKVKMVETWELLQGTYSDLVLSVHDELNFTSDDPELMKRVHECMECFDETSMLQISVPMIAEMRSGRNWYEAK